MKATITVHHVGLKNVEADLHLYCGRNQNIRPGLVRANLGNPFWMGFDESRRDEVCDAYDEFLHSEKGAEHRRIIDRIITRYKEGKSIALYCHCAPKRCHCDTIREYVLTNVDFG